ncbi:hypothetical protein F4677DRAFT_317516 [Hypoxylon crocopeplum]|nr:hypothetical protein F4677DRAFT_317516 [Hypoxylon crocopeplum]
MTSPQDGVLRTPELLEQVLCFVDYPDILVNAQRVSKHWNAVIKQSAPLQQGLGFQSSFLQPTMHNTLPTCGPPKSFANPSNTPGFPGNVPGRMVERTLISDLGGDLSEYSRRWLSQGASWRGIQVSEPPITKLSWLLYDDSIYKICDATLTAEFVFPDGLCMGDLYDLVLGTKGLHGFMWPLPWMVHRHPSFPMELGKLDVLHHTEGQEDPEERRILSQMWQLTSLQRFHANLRLLVKREEDQDTGEVRVEDVMSGLDSSAAMEMFLAKAQNPGQSD